MKTMKTLKMPRIFKTPSTMRLAVALLPILLITLGAQAQDAPAKPQTTAPKPAATAKPWTKIPIPPLHAFKPAQPRRVELANGLVIFLQEDHELPFINGTILIRGGSRDEPDAKVGLVSMYGETWRTSGTATVDGDKLDDQLEAKAASIETGGGSCLDVGDVVEPQGRLRLCLRLHDRSIAASDLQGGQAPVGQGAVGDGDRAAQRRRQWHRDARGREARVRPPQSLRATGRVRDGRCRHARRPEGVARQNRRAQQHHHRSLRRLRQRGDGSEAPCRL